MDAGLVYPDIGFTPEYQDLFADTAFGGEPCHFQAAGIDYRFYKRPVPGTEWFDITSPYGYSGPVVVGEQSNYYDFATGLHDWCVEHRVVSEFARLHPWQSSAPVNRTYSNEVAYIDLTQTEDEIWHGFDKGCKASIKQAQRQISTITVRPYLDGNFHPLYCRTMDNLSAQAVYYFNDSFWSKLLFIDGLNTIVASGAMALFFFYGDYATYFLSANDRVTQGAMNLILWTAIKEAKKRGCKVFNLGGGLHDGDSLSSFKRSFTSTTKPFYTYRRIHNQAAYNQLCKNKGIDPESDGYFPSYRRPI